MYVLFFREGFDEPSVSLHHTYAGAVAALKEEYKYSHLDRYYPEATVAAQMMALDALPLKQAYAYMKAEFDEVNDPLWIVEADPPREEGA